MTEASRKISNYIFDTSVAPIAKNRFGNVFSGRDIKNQRDVSVTVIPVTKVKRNFQAEEFQKKVEFLKALRGPNVVQIYDIILVPAPGYIYIVTEACHHRELGILLKTTRVIPEQHALRLVKQIDYAFKLIKELAPTNIDHEYNTLLQNHKQLSPSTIFLHGGRVKISESGIFALLEEVLEVQDYPDFFESSNYEAPEVYQQRETVSLAKADIWSLGVIVYQCIFGELPFKGNTVEEQHDYLERNGLFFPEEVRSETKDLLRRMLTFNPKTRISWSDILKHPALDHALVIQREGERRSLKDFETTLITALENTFNEIEDPSILLCPHLKPSHYKVVEKTISIGEYQPAQEAEEIVQRNLVFVEEQRKQVEPEKKEVIQVEAVQVFEQKVETQKGPEETNKQNEQPLVEKQETGKGKKKKEKKPKQPKKAKKQTENQTQDAEYVKVKRRQKDLGKSCNIF